MLHIKLATPQHDVKCRIDKHLYGSFNPEHPRQRAYYAYSYTGSAYE